ncbi:MAG: heparinase II/III-family protein, partial [bacterium]|nr:heparinase II/III-family protein [bacterium]
MCIRDRSTSYQGFVLELLTCVAAADEVARKRLRDVIGKMAEFLGALSGEVAEAPEFGDNDWAVASGILRRGGKYYRQVVAAARGMCEEGGGKRFEAIRTPVFWYTGMNEEEESVAEPKVFREGGYVIWNGIAEDELPVKVCMDVGGLGLGRLAAHGHADALSVTLHVKGEAVLIDPGTYTYHRELSWREYFRGTRAHSTLRVGGCDQARMDGPFLWGRHYRVELVHAVVSEDQFDVVARHDGYVRRYGVWHERRVAWHPLRGEWVICDKLCGRVRKVGVELLFHVHPRRVVGMVEADRVRVEGRGYVVELELPLRLRWRVAMGETEPALGWYSGVLGEKEPCGVIVGVGEVSEG